MRISSLHVVEVVLHERLNNVVEQLSVEVVVEYAEQSGICESGDAERLLYEPCDLILFLFSLLHHQAPFYQLSESSKSSSDGSSGSSPITVNI